jgi:hypothetical protein
MTVTPLRTYEDWRHCIEVACCLTLTPEFVATRIAELSDVRHQRTQRFVETWGEAHRQQVLAWLHEAGGRIRQ